MEKGEMTKIGEKEVTSFVAEMSELSRKKRELGSLSSSSSSSSSSVPSPPLSPHDPASHPVPVFLEKGGESHPDGTFKLYEP